MKIFPLSKLKISHFISNQKHAQHTVRPKAAISNLKMPIEMPKGLPFSVDTWTPSSKRKRHHFLTHAHKDHAQGIAAHASYPIFSTSLTRAIVQKYYPQLDESMFVGIEVGETLTVEDPDGDFVVTAYDANHCPGSVMFLFEGNFGNLLHTGDCRLTLECLQNLPDKYIGKNRKGPRCPLDYIFLDCTFGQFPLKMPSRDTATQQVINCIWKHPDAPKVYLTCDMLGQEGILVEVSQTFGDKIYVDKEKNLECFKALELTVPQIISEDRSSRFHLFDGFPKLYERAEAKIVEARANFQNEPLIIRPSAQWYACDEGLSETEKRRKERFDQAVRDVYGVWHVCYSIHSSKDELEWALHLLAPKWVISTTPPCRAMELDYVKKHCFNSKRACDDSLWKLLDISSVTSSVADVSVSNFSSSQVVESISDIFVETQFEPVVISTCQRKRLSLSPPSKRPRVTLFGRARLGLPDSAYQNEHKEILSTSSDTTERASFESKDICSQNEDVILVNYEQQLRTQKMAEFAETKCTSGAIEAEDVIVVHFEHQLGTKKMAEFAETKCTSGAKKTEAEKRAEISPIGLSTSYCDNLKRFYRSINVPVPQPLPSLVKLMDAKNRKRRERMLRFPRID